MAEHRHITVRFKAGAWRPVADWSAWDGEPAHPETDGFDFHPDPSIDEETDDG